MSEIVAYRERLMQTLRDKIPELRSVDWYDGLFDEQDVDEWIVDAPAAYVAVMGAPSTSQHTTGELNLSLKNLVTIVVEDRLAPRDADPACWTILEKIADTVNMNAFGDPNAAPACQPTLKRLRDPELRRQGVALGVVEWYSGYTLGTSSLEAHEYPHHPQTGERFPSIPQSPFLAETRIYRRPDLFDDETVDLSPPDPASPHPVDDTYE